MPFAFLIFSLRFSTLNDPPRSFLTLRSPLFQSPLTSPPCSLDLALSCFPNRSSHLRHSILGFRLLGRPDLSLPLWHRAVAILSLPTLASLNSRRHIDHALPVKAAQHSSWRPGPCDVSDPTSVGLCQPMQRAL